MGVRLELCIDTASRSLVECVAWLSPEGAGRRTLSQQSEVREEGGRWFSSFHQLFASTPSLFSSTCSCVLFVHNDDDVLWLLQVLWMTHLSLCTSTSRIVLTGASPWITFLFRSSKAYALSLSLALLESENIDNSSPLQICRPARL